ncbi:MAG: hypothetical protein ACI9F2_000938, partial [Lysobacterales bacterium]
ARVFNYDKDVFCLITEKDYNNYFSIEPMNQWQVEILSEEFVARKRMALDRGFLQALLQLDQKKVYDYIMEKVILLRKVSNG